jgi:hypothetical protein
MSDCTIIALTTCKVTKSETEMVLLVSYQNLKLISVLLTEQAYRSLKLISVLYTEQAYRNLKLISVL